MKKILLVANTSWYLYNYRLSLAKYLQSNGFEPVFVSPKDEYSDKIIAEGFRYIPVNIERKGINPFREIQVIFQLFNIYRKEKPDLIHQHTAKTVIYGTFASKRLRIPTVNSITGLGYAFTDRSSKARLLKSLILSLFKLSLRKCSICCVIFQNQANINYFVSKRIIQRSKTYYVPGSGAEKEYYFPEVKKPDTADSLIVMFPTRILWDKGVGVFADAAKILKERIANIRVVLVGTSDPGNPNAIPQPILDHWVSEGILECWGWKSNMRSVYNQCDVLAYPSFSEGLPRTLVEASLCETAIVATDIPGCNDIIRDNENGLLVPAHSALPLANAIEKLLLNQQLRQRLALNARIIAIEYFEQQVINKKTHVVYKRVLKN